MRTIITETGERGIMLESTGEATVLLRALASYEREMSKAKGMEIALHGDDGQQHMFRIRQDIAMAMYRAIKPFDETLTEAKRQDIMDDHEDARNLCHAKERRGR